MSPDIHRSAERWKTKLRPGEEMVWSSSVPELKPDLQRLTDEETKDYYGFLSSQMGKPDFGQADLDAYWKGKGRAAMAGDAGFFESIQKGIAPGPIDYSSRSEEHTSELQSLMRTSYAVFCLKTNK